MTGRLAPVPGILESLVRIARLEPAAQARSLAQLREQLETEKRLGAALPEPVWLALGGVFERWADVLEPKTPRTGDLIGRHRLGKELKERRNGLVFELKEDETWVLKHLRHLRSTHRHQQFQRDAQLSREFARRAPDAFVAVPEVGPQGDWFLMERCQLASEYFPRLGGENRERAAWTAGRELAHALHCLHADRLVHGDLRPDNVFLDAALRFKLGDLSASPPDPSSDAVRYAPIWLRRRVPPRTDPAVWHDLSSLTWFLLWALTGDDPGPDAEEAAVHELLAGPRGRGLLGQAIAAMFGDAPYASADAFRRALDLPEPGVRQSGEQSGSSETPAGARGPTGARSRGRKRGGPARPHIDFAVITIRIDEFQAVLDRFPEREPLGERWEYARVQTRDGKKRAVAIGRTLEQGHAPASLRVASAIRDLEPSWIVLAGIAGGIPDRDFTLGDVLLASRFHDVSLTAQSEGGHRTYQQTGGPVHPVVHRLLEVLPARQRRLGPWSSEESIGRPKPAFDVWALDGALDAADDSYRQRTRASIEHHFPVGQTPRAPRFHIGPLLTSNTLVKDTALIEEWRRAARQAIHVEMEAGGAYRAAQNEDGQPYPLLSVRGISDIVGLRREDAWTSYACHAAAAFLFAFITSGVVDGAG